MSSYVLFQVVDMKNNSLHVVKSNINNYKSKKTKNEFLFEMLELFSSFIYAILKSISRQFSSM